MNRPRPNTRNVKPNSLYPTSPDQTVREAMQAKPQKAQPKKPTFKKRPRQSKGGQRS